MKPGSKSMAYPNQDFGEAAPPDAGGHLGAFTRPDELFDAQRRDRPAVVEPLDTRPRSTPLTVPAVRVWLGIAAAVAALAIAIVVAAA